MAKGTLFIVSAPSGAGKTSLLKQLIGQDEQLHISMSYTTRPMRPGEIDGKDYHFVNHEGFLRKVEDGSFLEHARVFDNYYGTDRQEVREQLEQGFDVILEIDWQGAQQIRSQMFDTISIFILPPSEEELRHRLEGRGQDDEEVIAKRMSAARTEISHYLEYDYLVINDDFDQALQEMKSIVQADRLRQGRMAEVLEKQLGSLIN
jgi:guanylate kinase